MPPEPIREDAVGTPGRRSGELDIFGFVLLLLRHVRFIAGCGVVAFLLMAIFVMRAKPRYASTAVMIVPQGNVASVALQARLAMTTTDLLGGGYELYSDMAKSRRVADVLIKDYDLVHVYHARDIEGAELMLARMTKVETEREGVLRVTVDDTDPRRAADLANDYLHQLDLVNQGLVLSSAKEERVYLERELVKEKDALADAEVALKLTTESSSGLPPEAQATAGLSALETTRAQLRAAQIRLASLLAGETEENPEVVRLHREIDSLSAQLASLQGGSTNVENGTPIAKVPQAALLYTRALRDVKFHESLFELLEKEFEEAKQNEAKTPTIVQVLDAAVPPLHKAWPPRTFYCMLAGICGIIAGILLVALRGAALAYARNPENADKLRQLKVYYRNQFSRRA